MTAHFKVSDQIISNKPCSHCPMPMVIQYLNVTECTCASWQASCTTHGHHCSLSGLAPSLYRLFWNSDHFLAGLLLTTLSLDIWSILSLDYIAVLDFDILALYPRCWIFLDYQSPSSVWSVYFAALSYTFRILPSGLFADFQMAVMDHMFCVVMTVVSSPMPACRHVTLLDAISIWQIPRYL